jgi:hypothetical protein
VHAPIVPIALSDRRAHGSVKNVLMSDWGIPLITAGSAIAGSLVTGWYARSAGSKQAAAARHAGDRQADALLETVRMTLADSRAVRLLDLRRQTYVEFLEAAEIALQARRTGDDRHAEPGDSLQRAFAAVELEGPEEVTAVARVLIELMPRLSTTLDELEHARSDFIQAARTALTRPLTNPQ